MGQKMSHSRHALSMPPTVFSHRVLSIAPARVSRMPSITASLLASIVAAVRQCLLDTFTPVGTGIVSAANATRCRRRPSTAPASAAVSASFAFAPLVTRAALAAFHRATLPVSRSSSRVGCCFATSVARTAARRAPFSGSLVARSVRSRSAKARSPSARPSLRTSRTSIARRQLGTAPRRAGPPP